VTIEIKIPKGNIYPFLSHLLSRGGSLYIVATSDREIRETTVPRVDA
jgi:hypothetical protein